MRNNQKFQNKYKMFYQILLFSAAYGQLEQL